MRKALARRSALAGLAACCTGGPAWPAVTALPGVPRLLVAGPAGGSADRWAELIAPALGKGLQQSSALPKQNVGGADGVTAANQFEAYASPDGSTALLVPGLAALLWLAGDTRVKFDPARWVPIWAGTSSAALASRVRLAPGRPLRLAVPTAPCPVMAGLLALDLMGVEVTPVPISPDQTLPLDRPDVDALFLHGALLHAAAPGLRARGMNLVFSLGALNPAGETIRDPAFPDLPTAEAIVARTHPEAAPGLLGGLRAVTAAVQLEVGLILPQMSPAATVAWWRRGCAALPQSPQLLAEAARTGSRAASPQTAGALKTTIAGDRTALLELRRWLGERAIWPFA